MVGWHLMDMSLSKLREIVKDREAWSVAVHGVTKSWKRLSKEISFLSSTLISLSSISQLAESLLEGHFFLCGPILL